MHWILQLPPCHQSDLREPPPPRTSGSSLWYRIWWSNHVVSAPPLLVTPLAAPPSAAAAAADNAFTTRWIYSILPNLSFTLSLIIFNIRLIFCEHWRLNWRAASDAFTDSSMSMLECTWNKTRGSILETALSNISCLLSAASLLLCILATLRLFMLYFFLLHGPRFYPLVGFCNLYTCFFLIRGCGQPGIFTSIVLS